MIKINPIECKGREMVISKTPLRISFIGGGTDFRNYYEHQNGGLVVSTAIDKYIYVLVKRRFDSKTLIHWSHGREEPKTIDDIQHELVRECLKHIGVFEGLEIILFSDIPAHGSGLGSSCSVTVGLLNALYYMFDGVAYKAAYLAERACEIEIEILGKPIGKQDQYATAYGGFNSIKFWSNGGVDINCHKIPEWAITHLNNHLLLCYSGEGHSSDEILQEQDNNTSHNYETLSRLKYNANLFGKKLNYFGKEPSDMDWICDYLTMSWSYKKRLATVITNPRIDGLYQKAMKNGAMGGKLCGAGGGGFFLFYVKPENRQRVINALELDVYPFTINARGSEIILEQ